MWRLAEEKVCKSMKSRKYVNFCFFNLPNLDQISDGLESDLVSIPYNSDLVWNGMFRNICDCSDGLTSNTPYIRMTVVEWEIGKFLVNFSQWFSHTTTVNRVFFAWKGLGFFVLHQYPFLSLPTLRLENNISQHPGVPSVSQVNSRILFLVDRCSVLYILSRRLIFELPSPPYNNQSLIHAYTPNKTPRSKNGLN